MFVHSSVLSASFFVDKSLVQRYSSTLNDYSIVYVSQPAVFIISVGKKSDSRGRTVSFSDCQFLKQTLLMRIFW